MGDDMKTVGGIQGDCPSDFDHKKDAGATRHGSPEEPIPVEEMREDRYIQWEYEKISKTVGFNRRCMQSMLMNADRQIDRIVVREANRTHHVFYFDFSKQWKAGQDGMMDKIAKLKAGGKLPQWMLDELEKDKKGI